MSVRQSVRLRRFQAAFPVRDKVFALIPASRSLPRTGYMVLCFSADEPYVRNLCRCADIPKVHNRNAFPS
jgi:hypothetical protein